MDHRLFFRLATVCFLAAAIGRCFAADKLYSGKPLRVLLITGGCCHNYKFQSQAMTNGISKQADAEWTVVHEGGNGTRGQIDLYNNPDWAKPYDVIVHNECFADTDDAEYVRKITSAHKAGKPAVVIHCAMHTYRAVKFDDWREFLGVTSRMHEHQSKYPVKVVSRDHPVMKGFPENWVTPMDELYIVEKLWPGAKPLASSVSERTGKEQPVVWVNDFHGTRVFGTTYGHSDETFRDTVFIDLLARGVVWAAGKTEQSKSNRSRFRVVSRKGSHTYENDQSSPGCNSVHAIPGRIGSARVQLDGRNEGRETRVQIDGSAGLRA